MKAFDIEMMNLAISLAQKGEGWTNPNPLVGAVIVRDGKVIAQGHHARFGDLHAERNAFKDADSRGVDCNGATMYVTLEPCCHHGHQPPCTEAVIEHGIKRIIVGLCDPNPLVAGKGMQILRDAGIEAEFIDNQEILTRLRYQNRVFLKYITTGLPWLTAKWAMTLDGKIATSTGDSKWISSAESRQQVHLMRRRHLAIMCGIGTVLADDPMLNVRIPKEIMDAEGITDVRQPIRIVADRKLRIPLDSALVRTAREIPLIIATSEETDKQKEEQLKELGVKIWHCKNTRDIIEQAGKDKIDSIFVEGGGTLNEALLREDLIDEVNTFIAPKIIGGQDSLSPVEGIGIAKMADAIQLKDIKLKTIGNDILVQGLVQKT